MKGGGRLGTEWVKNVNYDDIYIFLSENYQKLIFQTYHSLIKKWFPLFCPVKSEVECWLHSLYLLFP